MMQHQQMIKASDDASSVQNSNTVRHKGKASSGRKVIWYFPRSLLEFIYKICGGCVFPHFENWVVNQIFICYSKKFANSWRAGDKKKLRELQQTPWYYFQSVSLNRTQI